MKPYQPSGTTPNPHSPYPSTYTPTRNVANPTGSTAFDLSAARTGSKASTEFRSPFSSTPSRFDERSLGITPRGGADYRERCLQLEARLASMEQDLDVKKRTIAKLESEAIQNLRSVGDVRTEEDTKRNAITIQFKRDIENERERTRAAQAELQMEQGKRTIFEQKSNKYEIENKKIPALEARIGELEMAVNEKVLERNEIQKKSMSLEQKVLELQNTNAVRMLEGKVAALQQRLDTRTSEWEEGRKNSVALNNKIEDLKETMTKLHDQLSQCEKANGEKTIALEESKREIERLENKVTSIDVELEAQIAKTAEGEGIRAALERERDQNELELRNEIRGKTKVINGLELERMQITDKLLECEGALAKKNAELDHAKDAIAELKVVVEKQLQAINTLECAAAKDAVVATGLQQQIERLKLSVEEGKRENVKLDGQRAALDQVVHELRQELRLKGALEEQLSSLKASFDRQEQDAMNEMRRHEDTKSRLADALEKIQHTSWMHQKLKDMESVIAQREEALDKSKKNEERYLLQMEESRRELDREVSKFGLLQNQYQAVKEERSGLEEKLIALEQVNVKNASLEGKVTALEAALAQRTEEVTQLQNSDADNQLRVRELEGAVEHLQIMESRAQEYHAEKIKIQHQLADLEDVRRELEREVAANEARAKQKENELENERVHLLDLEEEIAKLKRAYLEKAVLEPRVLELEQVLNSKSNEFERVNAKFQEIKERATTLEVELKKEKTRSEDLEKKLAAEVEVVEAQQTEAGRIAVALEQLEREKLKLQKESEWRAQQAELALQQTTRLQEELSLKTDLLNKVEHRENVLTNLNTEHTRRLTELEEANIELSNHLVSEKSRTNMLENRIVDLEGDVRQTTYLEGKIRALSATVEAKNDELLSATTNLQEMKLRVKELESEQENAQKLEQRIRELRAQLAQQVRTIEISEAEDGAKSKLLFERDRELTNEKEHVKQLQHQLSFTERNLADAKEKVTSLEVEAEKRTVLEGRIRGLEQLVQVRQAELEAERMNSSELTIQMKELEASLTNATRLDDVVAQLEAQVRIKNDVVQKLEQEEAKRRALLDRQQRDVERLQAEKSALEDTKAHLADQLIASKKEAERAVAEVQAQLEDTEEELRSKTVNLNKVQIVSMDLNTRLTQMEAQLGRWQERMRSAESESTTLKDELGKTERELGIRSVECDNLKRQLEIERVNIGHLTATLMQEKEWRTSLENDAKETASSHMHSERRIAAELRMREQEIIRLQEDQRELKRHLEERTQQYRSKCEEFTDSVTVRRNVEDECRQLHEDRNSKDREITAMSDQIHTLKRSLEDAVRRCQDSDATVHEREKIISQSTAKLQSAERRLKDEENRSQELSKTVRSQAMELAVMREAQQDAMRLQVSEAKDSKMRHKALSDERDALKHQLEVLHQEFAHAAKEEGTKLAHYEETIAALTQKAVVGDDLGMRLRETSQFMDLLRQENAKLRDELLRVQGELENSRNIVIQFQQRQSPPRKST